MFKNFIQTVRRYTMSSILNIIGLTVAFTVFIIIMIQVNFDRGFDGFHPKGERTYRVEITTDGIGYNSTLSRPIGEKIIEISPGIEHGSVFEQSNFYFYLPGGDPEKAIEESITMTVPAFFNMFEFDFIEGDAKNFDDRGNVIISQRIAQKLFPGEKALGKELRFRGGENKELTVVITGVYRDFPKNSILADNAIFRNIGQWNLNNESEWSFEYYITLRNTDNKADVDAQLAKYAKENFEKYDNFQFRLTPLPELHFLSDIDYDTIPKADSTTMGVLFGVALIILLIAAINFLNFAMALTPLKLKSINIKKIMGSSVFKLRMLQISEAVILVLIAFGLALLLVHGLGSTTFATLMTAPLKLSLNFNLLVTCLVIAIATGVLAGLFPAFYSTSFKPVLVIKGSFGSSRAGRSFRMILIGFQYVSSITLFCVAMFMIIQNNFMKSHPVGFDRDNVVCAYTSNTIGQSGDAVRAKLMTNPLIKDVAFSAGPIISNGKMGWGRTYNGQQVNFDCFPVSSNFVKFMDMEIVEGRDFMDADNQKVSGTFIFNQQAMSEIGFKIGESFNGHSDSVATIVGVVKNFNFQPLQYGVKPIALYVFGKEPWWQLTFINVRISGANMSQAIEFIDKTIKEFDPKLSELEIEFMDQAAGALYEKEENQATMISISAIIAMIISLVGVFGLVVFETQYRRKEIGLRKINGATVGIVLMMFNRKFMWIVFACSLIAVPVAIYAVNEWLGSFAYRTPIHWWVFALAILIVLLITVLTVTIQSWRAATENPVKSLKSE